MKKGMVLLLTAVLVFGQCGCEDKEVTAEKESEETETVLENADAKDEEEQEKPEETVPTVYSGDEYVKALTETFVTYGTAAGWKEISYQDISELDQDVLNEMHIADYRVLQMNDGGVFQLIVLLDEEYYAQLKPMLAQTYGLTVNEQGDYFASENDDQNGYAMRMYAGDNPYLLIGFMIDGSAVDTTMDDFCAQLNAIGYSK